MAKTAFITGASHGIGEAFAWLFAERGYDLILVSRHQDVLDTLAQKLYAKYGVHAEGVACDLSDPKQRVEKMKPLLQGRNIDVLINDAGFGLKGDFVKTDLATELNMIELNVAAVVALTKYVLPQMIERNKGKILTVSSMASFLPGPEMSIYYATKAFERSFSIAIQDELKGTGVTATVLCPGPTHTGFAKRAHVAQTNMFSRGMQTTPEEVAKVGFAALMAGKALTIVGHRNTLGAIAIKFLPTSWALRLAHGWHSNA